MSLEQAITDHASALRELAAAIRATVGGAPDVTAAADKAISDAKKPAPAPTKTDASAPKEAAQASEVKKAEVQEKPAAKAEAADSAPAPTYDDVKAKVLALSKEKGREPTVQLLQRHGVEKAPDLKPAQYADFIKDVDAIMAGTYNPEAAETV